MIRIGIIGATGYTGRELVRILLRHSRVKIAAITSETYTGKAFSDIYPEFKGVFDLILDSYNKEMIKENCDILFSALPHGLSQDRVPDLLELADRVIDLSGDFRLKEAKLYEEWYGYKHNNPELLSKGIYGLPEINRLKIKEAKLVSNPGCFPTSVLLALAPVLRGKVIDLENIIIDSKSGVSGAGRAPKLAFHLPECSENFKAYKVTGHQHTPEIEEQVAILAGEKVTINFTPHLVPMIRGILSTVYLKLTESISQEDIFKIYQQYYEKEQFVRIHQPPSLPETRFVAGTNYCDISLRLDRRNNRLIVISAIDNLVKGAAGQAVQNLNVLKGWPEGEGLI